jgi:hypothetical protein
MRQIAGLTALGALLTFAGCASSVAIVDAGDDDAGLVGLGPEYDGGGMPISYSPVMGPLGFTVAGAILQYLELPDGGSSGGGQTIVLADYPIGCTPNAPEPNQHLVTITLYTSTSGTFYIVDPRVTDPGMNNASDATLTLLNLDNTYYGQGGSGQVQISDFSTQTFTGTFSANISDQPDGSQAIPISAAFSQLLPCPQ